LRLSHADLLGQRQRRAAAIGEQLAGVELVFQLRRERIDQPTQGRDKDERADQQPDVQVQTKQQRQQGLLRAREQRWRLGADARGG